MKVGIVSSEFPPEKGGIQTYAFEFTQELARRGHDVTVFTTPHPVGELNSTPFRIEPVLKLRRRFDREILRHDASRIRVMPNHHAKSPTAASNRSNRDSRPFLRPTWLFSD